MVWAILDRKVEFLSTVCSYKMLWIISAVLNLRDNIVHLKQKVLRLTWESPCVLLLGGTHDRISKIWHASSMFSSLDVNLSKKKIHVFSYLKTLPTEDECPRSHIWALASLIWPLTPTSLQLLREPCAHLRENCRFLDLRELTMKIIGFACVYRRRNRFCFTVTLTVLSFSLK